MTMSALTAAELDVDFDVEDLESPDVPQIAAMGKDVLQSVQQIRDMLRARAEVLESCRGTLADQHSRLVELRERFEHEQDALCDEYEKREVDLCEREKAYEGLEERIQQLSAAFQLEADGLKARGEELQAREADHAEKSLALDLRDSALSDLEREFAEQKTQFEARIASLDADREKLRVAGRELGEAKSKFLREREELESERERHAQAAARLEADRREFADSQRELEQRQQALATQVAALEKREMMVVEQQGTLELRIQQLAKQKEDMIQLRRRWEEKISELNMASTNLSALREQLVEEVGHITNERNELLNRFGLTERAWNSGQPVDSGLPNLSDSMAGSASVERYQKLCRDARRRAIGAI
jgi:chromosome segregation ATPase